MIVGIDYSTHKIDIVGVLNKNPIFSAEHLIRKKEKFGNEHLSSAYDFVYDYFDTLTSYSYSSVDIYMEEPFIHSVHRSSVIPMAMMAGVIGLGIYNSVGVQGEDLLTMVPPPKWKKQIIGQGNANKDMIRMWVSNELTESQFERMISSKKYGSDQDLIDAYCIARYGEENRNG